MTKPRNTHPHADDRSATFDLQLATTPRPSRAIQPIRLCLVRERSGLVA
jgi:hypothetical protein